MERHRERMELTLCGGKPWGFSIKGGTPSNKLITVSKVEPRGKGEASGLQVGDVIICVNHVELSGVRKEAVELIIRSGPQLWLAVERTFPMNTMDIPTQGRPQPFESYNSDMRIQNPNPPQSVPANFQGRDQQSNYGGVRHRHHGNKEVERPSTSGPWHASKHPKTLQEHKAARLSYGDRGQPAPRRRTKSREWLESGDLRSTLGRNSSEFEIQHYIGKLKSSVTNEERLKLFHKISQYEPWQQRDIAKTITSIDFSGIPLEPQDVSAIGSIMNHSAHLDSVNLKACKLLPGSLQNLRNRMMQVVKVGKFRVDGNPNLTVYDLIAGVDLCVRVGARYVYDLDHLSSSDRQKFTSHAREYQPKDESIETKMSKTRKSLIREQRFQKIYKKTSSNERERIRHVLDFSSNFEEQPEPAERSKENPEAKMTPASSLDEKKVGPLQRDVEPAEGGKEDREKKETPGNSRGADDIGSPQLDVEPAEGGEEDQEEKQTPGNSREAEDIGSPQLDIEPPGGESSSGSARKIQPRTLNEFVKLKPVVKFNKMMKSSRSGEEVLASGSRAMHVRMFKTMAMNSDRRRFASASLNKFGSKLRSHMRNTRLEVSTGIVKSSKDDSGYKTRSSFSETLSCKSNLRKYSQRSDQDTERKSSIESTQAALLERIEEIETSAENSGSSDSPKTDRQKHEHDPKRLIEQRFEMTVLGLGALQNSSDGHDHDFQ